MREQFFGILLRPMCRIKQNYGGEWRLSLKSVQYVITDNYHWFMTMSILDFLHGPPDYWAMKNDWSKFIIINQLVYWFNRLYSSDTEASTLGFSCIIWFS